MNMLANETGDHALYRFYGADRDLLYIGISLHPFQRMGQHRTDKSWWGEVSKVTIDRYPSRQAVLAAERVAIKVENPKYNIVHAKPKRTRAPRIESQYTYWEPAVCRWMTVFNVIPTTYGRLSVTCRWCDTSRLADDFIELPDGQIYCQTICQSCKGQVGKTIPPEADRPLLVRRKVA